MDADIILNTAYLALVASTFTRTVFKLRLALMVGAAGFVVYGIVASIPTVIFWNAVTGSLHSLQLYRGALLGEMSFVRGQPANSDVDAVGEVRLRVWDQERLRALDQLNPPAGRAVSELVQRDLASKLS